MENAIGSSNNLRYQGSGPDDALNSLEARSTISLAAIRDATTSRLAGSVIDLGTSVDFSGGVLAHLSNFAEFSSNGSWTTSNGAGEMMSSLSINLTISLLAFMPIVPSTNASTTCSQTVTQNMYVYHSQALFGWYGTAIVSTAICTAIGLGTVCSFWESYLH
jgi:hypothetical protein